MRAWLSIGVVCVGCGMPETGPQLVFAGDLAPTRGVVAGVGTPDSKVWQGLEAAFPAESRWVVNLEADRLASSGSCTRADGLCVGVPGTWAATLALGPFAVVSRANNHANDFGGGAFPELSGIHQPSSGVAVELDDTAGANWSMVFVDLTKEGRGDLDSALRAVSLARVGGRVAAAMLHTGDEPNARPEPSHRNAITALVGAGASVVVGSGAHVIQDSSCEPSAAVWAGLGNLWMDQALPETQEGLAVGCHVSDALTCTAVRMQHDVRTPPKAVGPAGACTVQLPEAADLSWRAHPSSNEFAQVVPLLPGGVWLALWPQYSGRDGVVELRPHVYKVGGRRVAELWRGTALSSPITFAKAEGQGDICVLHRVDSMFADDRDPGVRQWQRWRWNGFGFETVDGPCDW